MKPSPDATGKGFFHSKAADRIGDVASWMGIVGVLVAIGMYFAGYDKGFCGMIGFTSSLLFIVALISPKQRHAEKKLGENIKSVRR